MVFLRHNAGKMEVVGLESGSSQTMVQFVCLVDIPELYHRQGCEKALGKYYFSTDARKYWGIQ